ncbi:MAG TPA: hypothetical protein VK660_08830 [Xanthomonadaceae bacterium]|nr:hypothetical protein [Xanthomonadaceae bacterium]
MADDPITIAAKIPYASDDVARDAVREQCDWNSELPATLVAKSGGMLVSTDQNLATVQGRKLVITATEVHGMAGHGFAGPSWIAVHGELSADGKVLGKFDFRRSTVHGRMTVCGTLSYIGRALSGNILNWLKNPTMNAAPGNSSESSDAGSAAP